jgi:hypothetical protein
VHKPQNKEEETHQEIPLEHLEAVAGDNGSAQNPKAEVQPNVPQIPILDFSFLIEPTGEMGTNWVEWMAKEQLEAAGTSSHPTQ